MYNLQGWIMAAMLVAALAMFTHLMVPRMRLLFALRPDNLFDQVPARILGTLKFAIGQWRMPREPGGRRGTHLYLLRLSPSSRSPPSPTLCTPTRPAGIVPGLGGPRR